MQVAGTMIFGPYDSSIFDEVTADISVLDMGTAKSIQLAIDRVAFVDENRNAPKDVAYELIASLPITTPGDIMLDCGRGLAVIPNRSTALSVGQTFRVRVIQVGAGQVRFRITIKARGIG